MADLMRWDPFRDFMDLRRSMDRLYANSYGQEGYQNAMMMPMDVCETQDAFEVDVAMPGFRPDDVDVTINNNTLTIRGEMRGQDEPEQSGRTYHLRERQWGSFVRSITLPSTIDAGKIEANYEDGILKLRIPKAEESKPKRIPVRGQGTQRTIEGKSRNTGGGS